MFVSVCAAVLYCVGDNLWCYWGCYTGTCILSLLFSLSDRLILFPCRALFSYSVLPFSPVLLCTITRLTGRRPLVSTFVSQTATILLYHFIASYYYLWNQRLFTSATAPISPPLFLFSLWSDWKNNNCFVFLLSCCTFMILAVFVFLWNWVCLYDRRLIWCLPVVYQLIIHKAACVFN